MTKAQNRLDRKEYPVKRQAQPEALAEPDHANILEIPTGDAQLQTRLKMIVVGIDESLDSWFRSVVVGQVMPLTADPDALEAMRKRVEKAGIPLLRPRRSPETERATQVVPLTPISTRIVVPLTPISTRIVVSPSPISTPLLAPLTHRATAALMKSISKDGPVALSTLNNRPLESLKRVHRTLQQESRTSTRDIVGRLYDVISLRALELDIALVEAGEVPSHISALTTALEPAESSPPGSERTPLRTNRSFKARTLARPIEQDLGVPLRANSLFDDMVAAVSNPDTPAHDFFGAFLADCQSARVPRPRVGALLGFHLLRAAAFQIEQAKQAVIALQPGASPTVWDGIVNDGDGLSIWVDTFQRTLNAVQREFGVSEPNALKLLEIVALFDPVKSSRRVAATELRNHLLRATANGDLGRIRDTVIRAAITQPDSFPKNTHQRFTDWKPERSFIGNTDKISSPHELNREILEILCHVPVEGEESITYRVQRALRQTDTFVTRTGEFCVVSLTANSGTYGEPSIEQHVYRLVRDGSEVYPVLEKKVTSKLQDFLHLVMTERLLAGGRFKFDVTRPVSAAVLTVRSTVGGLLEESGRGFPAIRTVGSNELGAVAL